MDPDELHRAVAPQQLAEAVKLRKDDLAVLHRPHAHGAPAVREDTYKGHRIRVVTSYEITLDGVPVTGHLLLTNEGNVHYHAIPNEEFGSMVDMVKRIIDLAPTLEPAPDHPHGGHTHGGGS